MERLKAIPMRARLLLVALLAVGCGVAYAATYNRVPSATFANADAVCGAQTGNMCWVTDCNAVPNCTAGSGSDQALLVRDENGDWVTVTNNGGLDTSFTGTTGDTFAIDTDGDNFTLDPSASALTFKREASGTVTLTAADDDATAALTIDPGGAAALTLGSADVTAIDNIVDTDFSVQNGTSGNLDIEFHDFADTTDDDQAHGRIRVNCTDTGSGSEDCDLSIGVAEAGAAPEDRITIDGDGDITVGSANNGGLVALIDNEFEIQNNASGNVDLSFRDFADTTDDDQAHALLRTNCTATGTGAEDCDFTIGIVEAGASPETRLQFDADGDIRLGSSNNDEVELVGTTIGVENPASGNVVLGFRDFADTTDDDQEHGSFTVNCTDTGSGSEDCDLTVGIVEGGNSPETRLNFDADGGITLGSGNTNTVTVSTDASNGGDAELVLPDSGVGQDEQVGIEKEIVFCGQLPNNGTNFVSPVLGFSSANTSTDWSIGSTGCDGEDSGTEGTADEVVFEDFAFKVTGFYCQVTSSGSNGVTLRLRSATSNLTPDVTCTIATGDTECATVTPTTTDVAAGATFAASAVDTEDLSGQDYWCTANLILQP